MHPAQLSKLLSIPDSHAQEILDYAATLSKDEAVNHFREFLGNSLEMRNFISAYELQREGSMTSQNTGAPANVTRISNKNTASHKSMSKGVPATSTSKISQKKMTQNDYTAASKKTQFGTSTHSSNPSGPIAHPSNLYPGLNQSKEKNARNGSPAFPNKVKIAISGGQSMHGTSTTISEIEAAIRSLEISTNSSLSSQDPSKRACNCIATQHPLLTAAPNCLSCGKVICVKEGFGPCTYCGEPLLSAVEVQKMISVLREDCGREKMLANDQRQKHATASSNSKPFPQSQPINTQISRAELEARTHRDKLLAFQAQNAKRTTVRDEVAEVNVDLAAVERDMIWATPVERARALKKQQKLLQEQEWNARPEYERKRMVVSLNVVGGKVVKNIGRTERRPQADLIAAAEKSSLEKEEMEPVAQEQGHSTQVFRRNPLELQQQKKPAYTWRRVQDNQDDNESYILDGGLKGREVD
ncbi:C2HC5 finger protein/Zinc finger, C2HC5-type [Blumeria hordei DH14]|uniref:C2HC5 finger protein/Zinc finger, C2HC5-type n=1 Tax=Blumeria graminis f. sp. hordei (strain DH14) TaxID=546991 RepID=N1J540_BLUG1|nr:C2HC5 finger protein/Zinc finger, C2HC5-type [Blumeria hordei DH14]